MSEVGSGHCYTLRLFLLFREFLGGWEIVPGGLGFMARVCGARFVFCFSDNSWAGGREYREGRDLWCVFVVLVAFYECVDVIYIFLLYTCVMGSVCGNDLYLLSRLFLKK